MKLLSNIKPMCPVWRRTVSRLEAADGLTMNVALHMFVRSPPQQCRQLIGMLQSCAATQYLVIRWRLDIASIMVSAQVDIDAGRYQYVLN